ncbi:hypothetical protein SDJN02_25887, partial [Cucurbita argyrosperma subsp. argyrosperma]
MQFRATLTPFAKKFLTPFWLHLYKQSLQFSSLRLRQTRVFFPFRQPRSFAYRSVDFGFQMLLYFTIVEHEQRRSKEADS